MITIPPLTRIRGRASFGAPLPDGVMVAQATLTRLVMVRIHVGQPFDALRLLMACGRRAKMPKRRRPAQQFTLSVERAPGLIRPPDSPVNSNLLLVEAHCLAPSSCQGQPVVYFLRLSSGTIYVGCSTDLDQRLDDHMSGQACRTTQVDRPIAVLRVEVLLTFPEARRREAQLKRWSRAKKAALIRGDSLVLRQLSRSRD